MPTHDATSPSYWYGYECMNHPCFDRHAVMLDVRVAGPYDPTTPHACPLCKQPMDYKGCWEATESGHGSRADNKPIRCMLCDADAATAVSLQQTKNGWVCAYPELAPPACLARAVYRDLAAL